jgi:hypothetical protein
MKNVDNKLAVILLSISGFSSIAFIWIGIYQPLSVTLTLTITAVIYLIAKNSLLYESTGTQPDGNNIPNIRYEIASLLILIIFFFLGVIIVYLTRNSLYRPYGVFFGETLLFIIILFEYCVVPNLRIFLIFQVFILLVITIYSSTIIFPYNGADTWYHLISAEKIQIAHSINGVEGSYRNYPLFQTLLALFSEALKIQVDYTARFLNLVVIIISFLLIFLAGKSVTKNTNWPLLLVLLLLGSKWFLYWSTLVVSMSAVLLFFCLAIVLLIERYYQKGGVIISAAILIISAVVPFFHPVGAAALIILFLVFGIILAVNNLGDNKKQSTLLFTLPIFIIVVTLTHWIFYGTFFNKTITNLWTTVFIDSSRSVGFASSYRTPLIFSLDNINFIILLSLSCLGILQKIHTKEKGFILDAGITGMCFVFFGYGAQIANIQAFLPYRWLLFGTLLLIFPATSALFLLLSNKKVAVRLITGTILIVYFFTGIINTEVNRDHPFYGEKITEQYEITSSEYAGLQFIQRATIKDEPHIYVDFRLWDYLKLIPLASKASYWKEMNIPDKNIIFAFRDIYLLRDAFIGTSAKTIDLLAPNYSVFYNSGNFKWVEYFELP